MKNKKLLLLLIGIIGILFPKSVFALNEPLNDTLKFTTTVNDWASGTDLVYTCGSSSVGVTPTVYVGADSSHLSATTCTFSFDSLNYNAGDDFIIVEVFDFSSYDSNTIEAESITITPGAVSSATIDYTDDSYMFGEYTYDPTDPDVTADLYNMNKLDQDGNIVSPVERYVYDAYFDIGSSKEVEMSLGSISLPTYKVIFHFAAKGNVASTYGTFYVTEFRSTEGITGSHGETKTVTTIGGSPLTKAQYDALIATAATYEDIPRDDEYTVVVTPGTESTSGTGVKSTDVYITATLESTYSQTGLLYTVVPFVILIGLVVVGYLIIRNNEIQDKEII